MGLTGPPSGQPQPLVEEFVVLEGQDYGNEIDVLLGWRQNGEWYYRLRPATFPNTEIGKLWVEDWKRANRGRFSEEQVREWHEESVRRAARDRD